VLVFRGAMIYSFAGGLVLTLSGVVAVLVVPKAAAGTDAEQQSDSKTAKAIMTFQVRTTPCYLFVIPKCLGNMPSC